MPNFSGECQVIESPDPILAVESDDAVLPCHVEPPGRHGRFCAGMAKTHAAL